MGVHKNTRTWKCSWFSARFQGHYPGGGLLLMGAWAPEVHRVYYLKNLGATPTAPSSRISCFCYAAKRACQLCKQVGGLRPDQAAPRWLSLCSSRRTETTSTSGERPPGPWKKRIEAPSNTRADKIRRFIILERTEPFTSEAKRSYQPESFCKHGSEQST
jgi:hypothetical protein